MIDISNDSDGLAVSAANVSFLHDRDSVGSCSETLHLRCQLAASLSCRIWTVLCGECQQSITNDQ